MSAVLTSPTARFPWWRWFNWLALDAVAVAVVWLKVFGEMTGARLAGVEFAALGVAVWVIYMADGLLDRSAPPEEQERAGRHWFAPRQAGWLVPLALLLLGLVIWWSLRGMGQNVFKSGVQLAGGVAVYSGILAASRWKLTSMPVLLLVAPLMTGIVLSPAMGGLLMPEGQVHLWRNWWRVAAVVFLLLALLPAMRKQGPAAPPPWMLFHKVLGGFLFARGVALAPMMHFETGPEMLWSAPVILFAGACALTSLGIGLWEQGGQETPEHQRLSRLYPWMGLTVAAGGLTEAVLADSWARPVLFAVAASAVALTALHALRFRVGVPALVMMARAAVLLAGLGALMAFHRM